MQKARLPNISSCVPRICSAFYSIRIWVWPGPVPRESAREKLVELVHAVGAGQGRSVVVLPKKVLRRIVW